MSNVDKCRLIIQEKKEIDWILHQRYHAVARQGGLSLEQFHLLVELDELMLELEDEGISINRIARKIHNAQNTVSERVSRLEDKGLVKRVRDEKDRRVSRVEMTDEGRKLLAEINEEANLNFALDALGVLSEEEIDSFLSTLKKIIMQMQKMEGGAHGV